MDADDPLTTREVVVDIAEPRDAKGVDPVDTARVGRTQEFGEVVAPTRRGGVLTPVADGGADHHLVAQAGPQLKIGQVHLDRPRSPGQFDVVIADPSRGPVGTHGQQHPQPFATSILDQERARCPCLVGMGQVVDAFGVRIRRGEHLDHGNRGRGHQ